MLHMLHTRHSSVKTKDHRPRSSITTSYKRLFRCVLTDGDAHVIIQMNFSTIVDDCQLQFCKGIDKLFHLIS